MNVLRYRDTALSALHGTSFRRDRATSHDIRIASKHRPIPRRLYLIGHLIYNGVIAAAIGAATWAFLVFTLSLG